MSAENRPGLEHAGEAARELDAVGLLTQRCLEVTEALQARELERACAEHPELATELRRRMAFLGAVGLRHANEPAADVPERLGDFQPLERLAGGGMGVVYRARQLSLGREVALKLVRPEQLYFPGARERFRREAESIASLQHPGIVPVYGAGEERGVPYLAMQLIDGCTLAEALAAVARRAPESLTGADLVATARMRVRDGQQAPPPPGFERGWIEAVVAVTRQVALALAHAHSHDVTHRDVKPSNVLLSRDGRAMLVDFGLTGSESADGLTRTGSQIGTLHYMAPERLRGERGVDARSDVYSLGVTLYELLALQAPFQADTRVALELLILDGRVDALRARNRAVDADLERVCLQAMAAEPERRYRNATALADDLGRWLAREPVTARTPGRLERAWRWTRRRKAASAAIVLGALLLGGVPTLLLVLTRRHSDELEHTLEVQRAALADKIKSYELLTRMVRTVAPSHAVGREITMMEGLDTMARHAADGDDSPRARAELLQMIARLHMTRSEPELAEPMLERAEALLRDGPYAECKERAMTLEAFGKLASSRGQLEPARQHFAEAARVMAVAEPWNTNFGAHMLASQALTYGEGVDPEREAELLREALARYVLDPEDSDDVEWLVTHRLILASLEAELGDPRAGLAQLEQVRADVASRGAPKFADRVRIASAEADIAHKLADHARAESVLGEVLDQAREVLGPHHDILAILLFKLGRARFGLGDALQGTELMEQACAIREALHGADAPATLQLREIVNRFVSSAAGAPAQR
jgi:hypothetical protein